jgi:hypothetical protein
MFTIKEYTVDVIADPFKILDGVRYEFILDLEVEEDDELYHESGVKLRVIYVVDEAVGRIAKYEFQAADTGKYMDIEMEDDELAMTAQFCADNYTKK